MNEETETCQEELVLVQPANLVDRPLTRLFHGIRWSDLVAEMNAELEIRDAA